LERLDDPPGLLPRKIQFGPTPVVLPPIAPALIPSAMIFSWAFALSALGPIPIWKGDALKIAEILLNDTIPVIPFWFALIVDEASLFAQSPRPRKEMVSHFIVFPVEFHERMVLSAVGLTHEIPLSWAKHRFVNAVWPHTVSSPLIVVPVNVVDPPTLRLR